MISKLGFSGQLTGKQGQSIEIKALKRYHNSRPKPVTNLRQATAGSIISDTENGSKLLVTEQVIGCQKSQEMRPVKAIKTVPIESHQENTFIKEDYLKQHPGKLFLVGGFDVVV